MKSKNPWLVCFSASLFFFFAYMQVNVFNALNPYLYAAFGLTSATQLGTLSSMYFYSTVLCLIPAGMTLDRFSTRKLILFFMLVIIICTLLFAASHTFLEGALCRLVLGAAGAFCLLSNVRLASRWFPPRRMALVIGLIVTLAMIGAMVAQTPLTLLVDHYGWRAAVYGDGALGFLILIWMSIFIQDYPPGTQTEHALHQAHLQSLGFWSCLGRSLLNVQNSLAGIYASLVNLPLFLLGAVWGSMYIVQVFHYTRTQASFVVTCLFIGMIVGSPVMGWFSDYLVRRKLPMILGALAALLLSLCLTYATHLSLLALEMVFFALGFIVAAQIIAYPLVAESNPAALTGTAESIASVLIMSGGFLIPVFPWLLERHWQHIYSASIPVYAVSDYRLAMAIMPVAFAIALIASLLLKETACEPYANKD